MMNNQSVLARYIAQTKSTDQILSRSNLNPVLQGLFNEAGSLILQRKFTEKNNLYSDVREKNLVICFGIFCTMPPH